MTGWRPRAAGQPATTATPVRCPLAALTAQLGKGDPATIAVVTDLYDRWQGLLRAGAQALRDAGEIDPDTDVDRVATAVVTAVAGGATLADLHRARRLPGGGSE